MLANAQRPEKAERVVVLRFVLVVADLDDGAEVRLRNDLVAEAGEVKKLVVGVKELLQKLLQAVKVDAGGVEPLEVDVDDVCALRSR